MNIINNNPYRLLGVYSTSPQREIVANQTKMKAFLKVSRQVAFPLDLKGILTDVSRSEQNVAEAVSKLTLPKDQLKYAQFWFAKCTQFDEIACGKLTNGDIDGAIEIWQKKETASSLQNLMVCALIKSELGNALRFAQTLYSSYSNEFVKIVLGDNRLAVSDNLVHDFLDAMCEEFNPKQFLGYITISEWKEYVGGKSTKPIIDKLLSDIEVCKSSRGKGPSARLSAGTKLMNDTSADLAQLSQFVSANDIQYQMVVDKLGLEILQCGIDYYNGSDEADAAHKAMVLQKYALSIVVGKMAKERCKENVDILTKIISELPPPEVFAEDKAIKEKLMNFSKQPQEISYSISLLNDTKNDLVSIKNKLGVNSAFYLKLSTLVVSCALGNVIEEMNSAQSMIVSYEDYKDVRKNVFKSSPFGRYSTGFSRFGLDDYDPFDDFTSYNEWVKFHNEQVASLKKVAENAWKAVKLMDKFDMEIKFKNNRYNENRRILKEICEKLGISTSTFSAGNGCMVVATIVIAISILVSCL